MKITLITVVSTSTPGPDTIYLETDLPEATWPFEEHLSLTFRAAWGKGLEYVKTHFPGVPICEVSREQHRHHFSEVLRTLSQEQGKNE